MTDLTPILNAVIALLAALVTAFVIPWIKRKTNAQDREDLLRWVEIAVAAAEQLWDSTQGEEKKKAVMTFLWEKGFTFSESEIDSAIEAAVLKLHHELTRGDDMSDVVQQVQGTAVTIMRSTTVFDAEHVEVTEEAE